MQFQEIDMQGKFHIERLSTMPAWAASDEGRLIYAEDTKRCYFGDDSEWLVFAFTEKDRDSAGSTPANLFHESQTTYLISNPGSGQAWQESSFIPWTNNTYDLGTSTLKWKYVYAYTLSGESTEATYADLAEKYTAPQDYPTGTIVEVSNSETYEMCAAARFSEKVSGVVSESPGYLMNAQADGINVGLVGRVPIRVIGPVKKRAWIIPAGDGLGQAGEKLYKMAIALESNDDPNEKMIECLLKV